VIHSWRIAVEARLRRLARGIRVRLLPLRYKLLPAHAAWRRPDPPQWPLEPASAKPGIAKYEFSMFSQNGEDGILRFIFSMIGCSSRVFLEFGFGAVENNSLRLILHEGFAGVFIDGSSAEVKALNSAARTMGITNVKAIQRFLDLGNLKATILAAGLPSGIDPLLIDVDGNDSWFWNDTDYVSARVVAIEFNASLGPDLSVTVPYEPLFESYAKLPWASATAHRSQPPCPD